MTNDDVLFAYRLRVLASARELGSVAAACRVHGIHRSTFYRWKGAVDRFGLEILRPRERRRPQMPNAIPVLVEQRIVAFALGYPGYGPARIASELARAKHGGFTVSPNGVWRVLRRHGLHTRALRNALLAGYAAPPAPAREPEPGAPHRSRPPRRARADGLLLHRAAGRHQGRRVAVQRDRRRLCLHLGRAAHDTQKPRRALLLAPGASRGRRAARAGWRLERVSTDNGSEFRNHAFDATLERLGAGHTLISPGRPQSNGFVERVQRTILEECWKPTFARYLVPKYMGLRRELERYLKLYNYDRTHNGRLTRGRTPAAVFGAAKMFE